MDLSIVIVNYNSDKLLGDCLRSIYESIKGIEFEIYVVDNNSNDASLRFTKEEFKNINYIENSNNIGFSRASNQGIKRCRGRYVLLLNPDTLINPGALEAMVKFMDMHQDIGITGPKIFDSDGKIQLSCRSLPSLNTAFFSRYSLLTRLFPNSQLSRRYLLSDFDHREIREVDWVSGSCMMIRGKLFEDIGLMDEDFFMYCEDVDFCHRAKIKGWRTVYFPDAQVVHYIGGSSKGSKSQTIIAHHRSMYIFYKKHFRNNFFLNIMVMSGIILRVGICILKDKLTKK
jgi:hypothetical protein